MEKQHLCGKAHQGNELEVNIILSIIYFTYVICLLYGLSLCNGVNGVQDVFFAYANQSVVMFDLTLSTPRGNQLRLLGVAKNGIAFSRKYECRERLFDPAKVMVIMNQTHYRMGNNIFA